MGKTKAGTADPTWVSFRGEDNSVCPECEHERSETRFRFSVWVAHRLGMRPPRARCDYEESSVESGLGLPGPCGCTATFHDGP